MPQTLELPQHTARIRQTVAAFVKKLDTIAQNRPDTIRFRMMVMNAILAKLITMRSAVKIRAVVERFEMEDSPEVADFFGGLVQELEARAIPKEQWDRILIPLYEQIHAEVFSKEVEET